MTARFEVSSLARRAGAAATVFVKDIGQGLLVVSHNTLALVGLAVVSLALTFGSQAELRSQIEAKVLDWLSARQEARAEADGDTLIATAEPDAVARATAADPRELNRQQAAVAQYLTRRYHVAPEPIARLVKEAWSAGPRAHLEPTLILAVMAVESGFNPFAQSSVGAQGLMQVMTRVHDDKYEAFGGNHAAFDPVTNLRVGVQVLRDAVRRGGSIEEGLRLYVGAANLGDDSGYTARVLAEQEQLNAALAGRTPVAQQAKPASGAADERVALLQH
ncbi:MAG: lytic transglycosylase domain-containing protein [Paucibacter sp.]|nr:lytic transglycosylase domain-containing protein [Roseateles sp.]